MMINLFSIFHIYKDMMKWRESGAYEIVKLVLIRTNELQKNEMQCKNYVSHAAPITARAQQPQFFLVKFTKGRMKEN